MAGYDNKRIGMMFPLRFEESDGVDKSAKPIRYISPCTYEEHIRQSLRTLLLTARGERFMRPKFGSGLGAYLFEGIDATTVSLIKREVRGTVERYEPRVELTDVKVDHSVQDLGVLRIAVYYRIKSTGASDETSVEVNGRRTK